MRHRVAGRGFGRNTHQRKALLRGLVTSLFDHLKIETTSAKAKEAKRLAEHVITLGKRGDLHARRVATAYIPDSKVITKLFNEIAPKITRSSGYLRIVKTRLRSGDSADMSILEFVDYDALRGEEKKEEKKTEKKAEKKTEKKTVKGKKKEKKEKEKKAS